MKKQLIFAITVALFVCIELSGCTQQSDQLNRETDRFIGTWIGIVPNFGIDEITIRLFSNDTVIIGSLNGTWEIKDGKLMFTFEGGGLLEYSYIFSNNNRTLTITYIITGVSSVLEKQ